jgi:hypothetical protein
MRHRPQVDYTSPSGLTQISGLASDGLTVMFPRVAEAPKAPRHSTPCDDRDTGDLSVVARVLSAVYANPTATPPPHGGSEDSYANLGDYFGLTAANPVRTTRVDGDWFHGDTAADRTLRSFLNRVAMIPGHAGGPGRPAGSLDTATFTAVSLGEFAGGATTGRQASR